MIIHFTIVPLTIWFYLSNVALQVAAYWPETNRGERCTTPCEYSRGYVFSGYICYPNHYMWDYCSPWPKHDYKGNRCLNNCDYHGNSYKWCYLRTGSWNYCSSGDQNAEPIETDGRDRKYYCLDECKPDYSIARWLPNIHTCTVATYTGWNYCTPRAPATPRARFWQSPTFSACSQDKTGQAFYTVKLSDSDGSESPTEMCNTYRDVVIAGRTIGQVQDCRRDARSIYGTVQTKFDRSLANSTINCYKFELEDPCEAMVQLGYECNDLRVPPNFYNATNMESLVQRMKMLNGQLQKFDDLETPVPEPRFTRDYPGFINQRIYNSFESDIFAFRLIDDTAKAHLNISAPQKCGNVSIYEHLAFNSSQSQYLTVSFDFGRTLIHALQKARQLPFNSSVYFVQIVTKDLELYDLTKPEVFAKHVGTAVDRDLLNYVRSWSLGVIADVKINASKMYRKFEVVVVNATRFKIEISEINPFNA